MTFSDHTQRSTTKAIRLSALVAMAIVWVLGWLLIQHGRDAKLSVVHHSVARAASGSETSLNRLLVSLDVLLADVSEWTRDLPPPTATAPADAGKAMPSLRRLLRTATNQNLMLRDVYVADGQGNVLASARADTPRLNELQAHGPMAQARQQASQALTISQPTAAHPLGQEQVIYLSRTTTLANGNKALVVAEVRVDLLSAELDPRDPSGLTAITLEDHDGNLIAAFPLPAAHPTQRLQPPLPALASAQATVLSQTRVGSVDAVVATRPLQHGGLWVSASQPIHQALEAWRDERNAIAAVAALLTVLLAGMWLGATRHVQRMAKASTEVAKANADLQAANLDLGSTLSLVQATLEATADAVLVVGQQGQIAEVNARYAQLLGMPRDDLIGSKGGILRKQLSTLLANPEEAMQTARLVFEQPHIDTRDELQFLDGRVYLRHSTPQLIDGRPCGRVWSLQDITAFREVELQLLAQTAQLDHARNDLAATLEALPDLLFELDEDGYYVEVQTHTSRKIGVAPDVLLGTRVTDTLPPKDAETIMGCLREAKANGSSYGTLVPLTIQGKALWFELSAACKTTSPGEPARFVMLARDVTERKANETLIWEQAHLDALTGLPNRRMFRQHLQDALLPHPSGQQVDTKVALMFIDLDRFKEVNDTHGHDTGDMLLRAAAQRLRGCVRDSDLVARLGGDEFTLVVHGLQTTQQVQDIAEKVLSRLAQPFDLGDEKEQISASVGVTLYPDDGLAWEDLIQQADQAMYAAKNAGRNRWERFSPAMQEAALVRARIGRDLRSALAGEQLSVVYQPMVNLRTGELQKAEALLRWHHPLQGLISPASFIPIAEDTGQINPIGRWVFEQATQQLAQWRQTLDPNFQISVNISPAQLRDGCTDSQGWPEHLAQLGLPGSSVVLEITEGILMEATESTRAQLARLHKAGMQIALDDFGTGYSAMSYLHQFDLHYLKIDQAFVRNLGVSSKDLALCKATIVMAHELGLKVVAEGIETAEQQRLLTLAGCDCGQGYLFAKPMSAKDFEAWASAHASNASAARNPDPLPTST